MANVLGSMVVQDITYTQAHHGLPFKITYQSGGVAGAETIRLNGTEVIFKIASGTSTATQIVACLAANPAALAIVTSAVTGTGSNAQKTCVQAYLSGGAFATAAAQELRYSARLEARTAGTAGNSIRTKFVDTGTLGITVAGSDITINIDDGFTTWQELKEKFESTADASNLVGFYAPMDLHDLSISISGQSLWTSFVALSGGTASSNQAVVVQDITYTNVTVGPSSQRKSITYTIGATAGSEVVTQDANGNINIQIENGVSTATQVVTAYSLSDSNGTAATPSGTIAFGSPSDGDTVVVTGPAGGPYTFTKAADDTGGNFSTATALASDIDGIVGLSAVNASGTITLTVDQRGTAPNSWTITGTGSYSGLSITFSGGTASTNITAAVTGTGSNAQKTVNLLATVASEATPSTKDYYNNQSGTALTSSYVAQPFGFHARTIVLKNDESGGSDTVSWSFDGTNTGGTLAPGETITLDMLGNGTAVISLKGTNAPDYHINVVGV